ncbi:aerobic-type carbon monoxide dehydrogenase small subunit (CoxS/CutS family) [Bacillus niacini]|jgi:aerobic-type carbon monoxide dehydrogenase small subunit (CoxS/CutS family)|uniref:Aerobic-type carbon monoxide dehydrogenase small subunit (CoxS/CutS family) n=1 Tax=Neobacillus niacini TaxID=86668 RepID=A0A852TIJ9_9BACI|nr:(2Fe-2S)-binding protein [Neobacillus niacini]NYE07058.1 aerobic-type carbon monoxide dehydrogenase small subunit (CoxS/CutS family) [Neobacillus niacini]
MSYCNVKIKINGEVIEKEVESRWLLSDFLRDKLGLTGTHVGCEHGVCGACTVLLNGEPVRSCLMLAVQADGLEVETVESLAEEDGTFHPIQQAFANNHALQCGFCTPGFLMSVKNFMETHPDLPTDDEIREAISGNLCRCTGYSNIIKAVKEAYVLKC